MSAADRRTLFAAAAYCSLLLSCWLLSASVFQALLGDRPRLVLVGAQLFGILLPALLLTRAFSALGLPPRTSRSPPPSAAALALAVPGLAVSAYLLGLSIHYSWLRGLNATGWAWVGRHEERVGERYAELFTAHSAAELALVLLMVSLVPALCEEVAFRRGLQGLLASRGGGAAAVLTSAAIFSAFHLEPLGLPTRFFLGVSLGIAYHRCGALWVPGLLHALHNLTTVVALRLAAQGGASQPGTLEQLERIPPGEVATLAALGLAGWLVSLGLLRPARGRATA